MATLNELKKRLRKCQRRPASCAGAMKTVSTAKYSKLCSVLEQYRPYAREAFRMFSAAGVAALPAAEGGEKPYCRHKRQPWAMRRL